MTATNGIANGVAHDDLQYFDDAEDLSVPPHSTQAEEAVLGSVLKRGLSVADVLPFLKPHHFYEARHRHIYAAMAALFERAGRDGHWQDSDRRPDRATRSGAPRPGGVCEHGADRRRSCGPPGVGNY